MISTTAEELYSLLALIIFIGIVHAPTVNISWSIATSYSGFFTRRLLSSCKRFTALLTFLHVLDPETEDMHDKLRIVGFLYDHIRQRCKDLYQPSRQFSVGERMVKSKGWFSFKPYTKSKPARWYIVQNLCQRQQIESPIAQYYFYSNSSLFLSAQN